MLWHALKRNEMHWTNNMDTRHAMPGVGRRGARKAKAAAGKKKVGWT
jgi:hypothetical protein